MTELLTYVFCLVRSARKPVVTGGPAELPGASDLRVLNAWPRTWLIVASVPARAYGEEALAKGLQNLDWVGPRAMAHEAVVEHFLPAAAVLPMQMFSLFTSDERALEHVRRGRRKIDGILSRIERQHEWGLRLTWDEKAVREATAARTAASPPDGAAYLTRKRDLLDVTRVQLVAAKAEADRLFKAMAGEATDARRRGSLERAAAGSRLLLDAAFLVPVKRAGAFRSALRKQTRAFRAPGIVVSLTGPWPPYNFI